jgi:hypothetical protein
MLPMEKLILTGINPIVADRIAPMVDEIIKEHPRNVHSFHIVGSAVLPDFNEKLSDINSVVVLQNMDLKFITFLAPLGKKYGRKKIAAPLVMTPKYIQDSLDAFPVEFLDFMLVHKTVYGEDILKDIRIEKLPLRLQCEREIKTKLISLRQGYISSLGKKERLAIVLVRSITGSMALFRAIITLLGNEPPVPRAAVVKTFGAATAIGTEIFEKLLMLKAGTVKFSEQQLHDLFEQYYKALESAGKIIDDLHVQ